jgi:hypothetical protein
MLFHWFLHATGSDNVSGVEYGFWSGFGGDLTVVGALLTAPAIYVKHHNCSRTRCLRLGHVRHEDGKSVVLCHRHHVPEQ